MHRPDFDNILKICSREKPSRPTRFEFFLNDTIASHFAGKAVSAEYNTLEWNRLNIESFTRTGHDYCTAGVPGFSFYAGEVHKEKSISLNDGAVIADRADFEAYAWPDPDTADYGALEEAARYLAPGMKLIVHGPNGVLETAEKLLGFENMCVLTMADPLLTSDIFEAIGSRLLRLYEHVVSLDCVGAIIGNDDWGFKNQTMLAPEALREYVFPWHQKIVAAAHNAGKPAILHSCGNLAAVYNDIIDDMRYDAKHSYEDAILPVEEFYKKYHSRIAVIGGIDVDFLCRASREQIVARAENLVALTEGCTGYALGSGNSIPDYVPVENYLALLSVC